MKQLINYFLHQNRLVIFILFVIVFFGIHQYRTMPKENAPNIDIPIINVSTRLEGISLEDNERLLLKPMEKELSHISGIKNMKGVAKNSSANVSIEFESNVNTEKALQDVNNKINVIKSKLPREAGDVNVHEMNLSLIPIISVSIFGDVSRKLIDDAAERFKDAIEAIEGVRMVSMVGKQDKSLEINIDPLALRSLKLGIGQILNSISANNKMIAAGDFIKKHGSHSIEVQGMFTGVEDVLSVPLINSEDHVLLLRQIASGMVRFDDDKSSVRINSKPGILLEIVKDKGANIIKTIDSVKAVVGVLKKDLPRGVNVLFAQDSSGVILDGVESLENNILCAIILIILITVIYMGWKSAVLISMSLPVSLLIAINIISLCGFTLNIVVLFSLILSVGMLVDAAIVIVEYADRRMLIGDTSYDAYRRSSLNMFSPIFSSIATTLIVFVPMFFWPGVVGKFMFFLPATLIATLFGSLASAIVFVPVFGSIFNKKTSKSKAQEEHAKAVESGNLEKLDNFRLGYVALLDKVLFHPGKFLFSILIFSASVICIYIFFGCGTSFFPVIDSDNILITVKNQDGLSLVQKGEILKQVEDVVNECSSEIAFSYAEFGVLNNNSSDVIGVLNLELIDWYKRRASALVSRDLRYCVAGISGVDVEVNELRKGPERDKPFVLSISSSDKKTLNKSADDILRKMQKIGGFSDIEDSRGFSKVTWVVSVDREKAALFNADIRSIGNMISMLGNGVNVGTYRPNDDSVERNIIIRFPEKYRAISYIENLYVFNNKASVPLSNFVNIVPQRDAASVLRRNGYSIIEVKANIAKNKLLNDQINLLTEDLSIDKNVVLDFRGDRANQEEAGTFLKNAFIIAICGVIIVLLTQFNSFCYTLIIITAIIFSSVGVLLGLLLTHRPFGIVMCGVGVIALAGIVVNNNILLIDAYNINIKEGMRAKKAIIVACISRIRPVLLTTGTTVLGLVPMMIGLNINFMKLKITMNDPSSQWWKHLATTIVGGLSFATVLTLFFTPALLLFMSSLGKVNKRLTRR